MEAIPLLRKGLSRESEHGSSTGNEQIPVYAMPRPWSFEDPGFELRGVGRSEIDPQKITGNVTRPNRWTYSSYASRNRSG